jgi:phenylacetate-coenzyme A ligase PaaK-like adenylate-forming protein
MDRFDEIITDPAVRRGDVEAHAAKMQAGERFRERYFVASTSGSTGLRGLFVWDELEWATVMLLTRGVKIGPVCQPR